MSDVDKADREDGDATSLDGTVTTVVAACVGLQPIQQLAHQCIQCLMLRPSGGCKIDCVNGVPPTELVCGILPRRTNRKGVTPWLTLSNRPRLSCRRLNASNRSWPAPQVSTTSLARKASSPDCL